MLAVILGLLLVGLAVKAWRSSRGPAPAAPTVPQTF